MVQLAEPPVAVPALLSRGEYRARIEKAEEALLPLPQLDCPLVHRFAPGVYLREIFMPKGAFVIGHEHKTEHFNIILSGAANVMMDGKIERVVGPCVLVSKPGVRKVLFILEDMRWTTVHPTEETDLVRLEADLVTKSDAFLKHLTESQMKELAAA